MQWSHKRTVYIDQPPDLATECRLPQAEQDVRPTIPLRPQIAQIYVWNIMTRTVIIHLGAWVAKIHHGEAGLQR